MPANQIGTFGIGPGMGHLVALAGPTIGLVSPAAFTASAYAVGETCNGLPATLVGSPGRTATGTDGPDVIVSNGVTLVHGGAGDDVICATGSAAPLVGEALGGGDDGRDTCVSIEVKKGCERS